MVCIEQQTLLLPIPGCAPAYYNTIAAYYRSKNFSIFGGPPIGESDPNAEHSPISLPPLPWRELYKANPLVSQVSKVLAVISDPFDRVANLIHQLIPDYLKLTSREINEIITTGILFNSFPIETMPTTAYLDGLPRPRLDNGGRVRVFLENDFNSWSNIKGFLVAPDNLQLLKNNKPVIGFDLEAENVIRNYYEDDFKIVVDKSYFI